MSCVGQNIMKFSTRKHAACRLKLLRRPTWCDNMRWNQPKKKRERNYNDLETFVKFSGAVTFLTAENIHIDHFKNQNLVSFFDNRLIFRYLLASYILINTLSRTAVCPSAVMNYESPNDL